MSKGKKGKKKSATSSQFNDCNHRQVNGEMLHSAVSWIVDQRIFEDLKFHGNTKWNISDLIVLAVLWVWSEKGTLNGGFEDARYWSLKMIGRVAVKSYQGLIGALVTMTVTLLPILWNRLQVLMEQHACRRQC